MLTNEQRAMLARMCGGKIESGPGLALDWGFPDGEKIHTSRWLPVSNSEQMLRVLESLVRKKDGNGKLLSAFGWSKALHLLADLADKVNYKKLGRFNYGEAICYARLEAEGGG